MTSLSQQSSSSSAPESPTLPAPVTPPIVSTAAARWPVEADGARIERPVWASQGLRIVAGLVSLGVLAWLLLRP